MIDDLESRASSFWEDYCDQKAPDRRWRRAIKLLQSPKPGQYRAKENDPVVHEAAHAELARRRRVAAHDNAHPVKPKIHSVPDRHLLEAIELGLAPSGMGDLIRAYLLADQSPGTVAPLVGIEPPVSRWFERLFFDVRGRLEASGWIWAFILEPAFQALDPSSPEYAMARDRAVLFRTAYSGGFDMLKRIVRPAGEFIPDGSLSLLNDSPLARILTWLWTTEGSLNFDVQLLERIDKLLRTCSPHNDRDLNDRLHVLATYIDHHERKQTARRDRARQPRQRRTAKTQPAGSARPAPKSNDHERSSRNPSKSKEVKSHPAGNCSAESAA